MRTWLSRKRLLFFAWAFAAGGALGLFIAAVSESISRVAGYGGGVLLAVAYLWALALVSFDGKPIQTRSGKPITREENPVAYRAMFLFMSLFGWVPMVVFLLSLLASRG